MSHLENASNLKVLKRNFGKIILIKLSNITSFIEFVAFGRRNGSFFPPKGGT